MCVVGGTAKLNRIIIRCHTFNFKPNPYHYVFLIPPRFSLNPCIFYYLFLSNILNVMNLFSMNLAWKQTSWFLRNSKMVRMNFRLRPSNTEYTEVCRFFILHSAYTYFTSCYFVYKISSIRKARTVSLLVYIYLYIW